MRVSLVLAMLVLPFFLVGGVLLILVSLLINGFLILLFSDFLNTIESAGIRRGGGDSEWVVVGAPTRTLTDAARSATAHDLADDGFLRAAVLRA